MYSRSRMAGGEDRYTENLPPVYNGNRFSYARRDVNSPPPEEHKAPVISETEEAELACEAVADAEESHPAPTPQPGGIFSGIGQEELLLIALLLLLSAEHEQSMDIIVILLLLIGIH